jgi:predicted nucleic acid-binding protein
MRVVVDMNVLISATIKPNSPLAQILVYIRNGRFEFLCFPEFLKEYAEVISRPRPEFTSQDEQNSPPLRRTLSASQDGASRVDQSRHGCASRPSG